MSRYGNLIGQALSLNEFERGHLADVMLQSLGPPPGVLGEDNPNFKAILERRAASVLPPDFVPNTEVRIEIPFLLGEFKHRLMQRGDAIFEYDECAYQIELADLFDDWNLKAIREYPYPGSRETCDITIVDQEDFWKPQIWIELKPLVWCSNYWNRSKFASGCFENDIRKLSTPMGQRIFLLVAFSELDVLDETDHNIVTPGSMTIPQMAYSISGWASNAAHHLVTSFPVKDKYCHLLAWEVTNYSTTNPINATT